MKAAIAIIIVLVLGFLAWKYIPWNNVASGPAQAAALALADRFQTDKKYVEVLNVTKKEWSDSCLGLGKKEESCLQAITPGFEVVLKAEGEEKIYRTNADGSVVRAAN